jgi:hypothetical protein
MEAAMDPTMRNFIVAAIVVLVAVLLYGAYEAQVFSNRPVSTPTVTPPSPLRAP